MTIRRIAVAVDASEPARRAAQRALGLAKSFQAEVTLVHVYEAGSAETTSVLSANAIVSESRRQGERALEALVTGLGEAQLDTRLLLGYDVPGTVCDAARDLDADLIVVGTLGRTGVSRFFLGSVAENVMRRAHCPVWVERPSTPALSEVERVVVCTDLSAASEAGVALAAASSGSLKGSVELVYALESPYRGLSVDARKELVGKLRQQVTELAAKYFEDTLPRVTIVEGANVVDGITAHASRMSADLLVLATHGRTGLERAFMGSVAERVARFAPCSVLVARSALGS